METIWDVVAAQAAERPSAEAMRGNRHCTYAELIRVAEDLSRDICAHGQPGCLVALDGLSPAAASIAMLAAAQAGCAVLPLSAESPQRQREYILADSRPAVLVRECDDGLAVVPELVAEPARLGVPGEPPYTTGMSDIAYVTYTSGSTGRPKGVVVPHSALLARLSGLARQPGFGPDDSMLAMSAISFDISVVELMLPLTVGGCFVAAPPGTRVDPAIFARVVAESAPSVVQATPSFWRLALAWGWRGPVQARLWCGGEVLTADLAARLLPTADQLWNLYGPTETTLWATAAPIQVPEAIPLGHPLLGTELFLEGEDGSEVTAPGELGEIILSGAGLARGYLNKPDLTDRSFVIRRRDGQEQRCYRTGDMAAWRTDGSLRFAGRVDGQVKIRGHRVELGELEAVVERHPAVAETVAVLRDADGPDAQIVMYVVTDGTAGSREIGKWIAEWIPQGARPSRIVIATTLPRTTSGKADRVQLAARELRR